MFKTPDQVSRESREAVVSQNLTDASATVAAKLDTYGRGQSMPIELHSTYYENVVKIIAELRQSGWIVKDERLREQGFSHYFTVTGR
jgi:hypothetical protein